MSKTLSKKEQQIADKFKKMTQREHVYELPDTYIGSIVTQESEQFVLHDNEIKKKTILFNEGLFKIYDEALVNARDHAVRDDTCNRIEVSIDQEEGFIKIFNNGQQGIPVERHPQHKIYVPQMLFGSLLSSSNYHQENKLTGGKNGVGISLCNIFSLRFELEVICDKKKYFQVFEDNLKVTNEPKISKTTKQNSVCIKFYPDYKRFNYKGLTDDMLSLFRKRVYDLAGCTEKHVKVFLDGQRIEIKTFDQYIKMYNKKDNLVYQDINDRWQVGMIYKPHQHYSQVSFVNGIATYRGGTHVDLILKQLVEGLQKHPKCKQYKLSVSNLKDHLNIFVNSTIEDPSFNSQTKEQLTNNLDKKWQTDNKFSPVLSQQFITDMIKQGILDTIIQSLQFVEMAQFNKKTDCNMTKNNQNKLKLITKLDDAIKASSSSASERQKCRLFLSEGDSAKAQIITGLDVIGKEYYGVFPLKGKFVNVSDMKTTQQLKKLSENEEFVNIKQILGLKQDCKYKTKKERESLRYGGVIIMTDSDDDGIHIRLLMINLFYHFWPELYRSGYIQTMITPIIQVYKSSDKKQLKPINKFYTIREYQVWKEQNQDKRVSIKYYKGLGTWQNKETKDIFKNYNRNIVQYVHDDLVCDDDKDLNYNDYCLQLAFNKDNADLRKDWLAQYDPVNSYVEYNEDSDTKSITYHESVNKELINFSIYDTLRSIPGIDGLKISQRKTMYATLLKNWDNVSSIKVERFASYVSETTAYHHGESSLHGVIIGLAQDFVGSNNINLLYPNGQFGTRRKGGEDSASPRYAETSLNAITKTIYNKIDFNVLIFNYEETQKIEPCTLPPCVPLSVINGQKGIGTGYSTDIPSYNPLDVCNKMIQLIKGKKIKNDLIPYYRGFKGTIEKVSQNKFKVTGTYIVAKNDTIIVTELPIGTWTQKYKEYLNKYLVIDDKKDNDEEKYILGYEDFSTSNDIRIEIRIKRDIYQQIYDDEDLIVEIFKLSTTKSTSNLTLIDQNKKIKCYDTIKDILIDFYEYRLPIYGHRHQYMLQQLDHDITLLSWKIKFIKDINNDIITVYKKTKDDVIKQLMKKDYPKMTSKFTYVDHLRDQQEEGGLIQQSESDQEDEEGSGSYEYITSMRIFQMTIDEMNKLQQQLDSKQEEYDSLKDKQPSDLWLEDLQRFKSEYQTFIKNE